MSAQIVCEARIIVNPRIPESVVGVEWADTVAMSAYTTTASDCLFYRVSSLYLLSERKQTKGATKQSYKETHAEAQRTN